MRFNLETSKLLYEVRYRNLTSKESYTYQQLYKDRYGKYFIHFIGGKYNESDIKTSYTGFVGREGNYFINERKIDLWKKIAKHIHEECQDECAIINWEKEEKESIAWEEYIPLEELPF
ncbi:hypothetical protein UT300005_33000 [Clostridium sp. CTA-5]